MKAPSIFIPITIFLLCLSSARAEIEPSPATSEEIKKFENSIVTKPAPPAELPPVTIPAPLPAKPQKPWRLTPRKMTVKPLVRTPVPETIEAPIEKKRPFAFASALGLAHRSYVETERPSSSTISLNARFAGRVAITPSWFGLVDTELSLFSIHSGSAGSVRFARVNVQGGYARKLSRWGGGLSAGYGYRAMLPRLAGYGYQHVNALLLSPELFYDPSPRSRIQLRLAYGAILSSNPIDNRELSIELVSSARFGDWEPWVAVSATDLHFKTDRIEGNDTGMGINTGVIW